MKNPFLKILVLSLILASCGKEENPTVYAEDFGFFVKGQADGLPFEYNAGEDGYFMQTDYTVEDSVVIMEGRLFRESDPYHNAFTIRIRGNSRVSAVSNFKVEENIKAQHYAFRDATGFRAQPGKYLLRFFNDSSITGSVDYNWFFPEGPPYNGPDPDKTVDVNQFSIYPVTLKTTVGGLCESSVTHYVNLEMDCDATFRLAVNTPGIAETHVIGRIGTISRVEWFLDGISVTNNFPGEILLAQVPGADTLTCIVYFEDGCTKRIDRDIATVATSPCVTDFWYTKEKPTTYDPQQYSTIEIEYLDGNGKKYSSYYTQVQGDFKITSALPYQQNPNGQNTMRFFLETDVILRNADGSSVELKNTFGSFAVAHP